MMQRKQHIIGTIGDLVSNFLFYDRKEDEVLPLDEIENAIKSGEITIDEIVATFKQELESGVNG